MPPLAPQLHTSSSPTTLKPVRPLQWPPGHPTALAQTGFPWSRARDLYVARFGREPLPEDRSAFEHYRLDPEVWIECIQQLNAWTLRALDQTPAEAGQQRSL